MIIRVGLVRGHIVWQFISRMLFMDRPPDTGSHKGRCVTIGRGFFRTLLRHRVQLRRVRLHRNGSRW